MMNPVLRNFCLLLRPVPFTRAWIALCLPRWAHGLPQATSYRRLTPASRASAVAASSTDSSSLPPPSMLLISDHPVTKLSLLDASGSLRSLCNPRFSASFLYPPSLNPPLYRLTAVPCQPTSPFRPFLLPPLSPVPHHRTSFTCRGARFPVMGVGGRGCEPW